MQEYSYIEYDYDDITYPVPFNLLVSDIQYRYLSYGKEIPSIPFVLTGDIPRFESQTSSVLMITGASHNHAFGSFNCLLSMVLADPYASYMYLDFGIIQKEKDILFAHLDTIHQIQIKMKSTGFIAYRKFQWSSFPKWMWIEGNEYRQDGYAWKVIAHMDAAFAWKGITIWLDGGNLIREGISRELTNARVDGIYSPPSGGNQKRWTHPDCAEFLIKNNLVKHFSYRDPNCSSGLIVSDYSNTEVVNKVLYPFYQCAYTQKCITPRKSNKKNHRQDQAVLSALINNLKTQRSMRWSFDFHPAFRWEFGNDEYKCKKISATLLRSIQDTYQIRINSTYIPPERMIYSKLYGPYVSRPIDQHWHPQRL